jgi:hypothetical protein
MQERWQRVRALMGGTAAMRAAGEVYLPRFSEESQNNYNNRLMRSVLVNVFRRAARTLTGKVFAEPVTLGEDMPKEMVDWSEDIDLQGNHINIFARRFFRGGLVAGLTHILVEHPKVDPQATLADERKNNIRPYFCHVLAEQVIAARAQIINGYEVLTHLRLIESTIVPDGEFGEAEIQQIRVYDRVELVVGQPAVFWRLFQMSEGGDWMVVDQGQLSIPIIPMVTLYFDRTAFMQSDLPLEDLAFINILHWQASSDHHNALTYARFPIVKAIGISDKEADAIVIGPNKMVSTSNENADIGYLEHEGKAFDSSYKELDNLMIAMDVMAMEPMMPRSTGVQTATAWRVDDIQANSPLQAWAIAAGDALEQAYHIMAMYRTNMESGSVTLNTEVGLSLNDIKDIESLLKMRVARELSYDTYILELQRRKFLVDGIDPTTEAEKIANESPGDDTIGGDDTVGGGDDTTKAAE